MKKREIITGKKKMVYRIIALVIGVLLFGGLVYHIYNINYAKRIITALKADDYTKAIELINKPGNVNYQNGFYLGYFLEIHTDMPLEYACLKGKDISVVKALLENGAKTEYIYFFSRYDVLSKVLAHRHENDFEVAKLLLEYAANPNGTVGSFHPLELVSAGSIKSLEEAQREYDIYKLLKSYGSTYRVNILLESAAFGNNYLIVEDILQNEKPEKDIISSALPNAARESSKESLILLLQAGADKTTKDRYGKTALDYAIENDDQEIIELLHSA